MRNMAPILLFMTLACSTQLNADSAKVCAIDYIKKNKPYYRFEANLAEVTDMGKYWRVKFRLAENYIGGEAEVQVDKNLCRIIGFSGSQ